ncbi:sugar ABC transporter ATP-binding protein [Modestobacter excelsi]|uniref:sugar ABC transporter ATP-binding protein n=1 Tax=Modestobacter excelsi TaxID=2213161 RepID=UPI001C20C969|nr:sugar ABC transporter ATP-binding protein [Modestobacter excelsi]
MTPVLGVRGISKSFNSVRVLDGVDIEIPAGSIHGLVGENGSGKSTLVKILTGVYTPDDGGTVDLWGQRVTFPIDAGSRGITVIHQDLGLADDLTVAENIGITSSFGTRLWWPLSWRRERAVVLELCAKYGLRLDPRARVSSLTPAERTLVAVLRALRKLSDDSGNQLIILDEPTAALPHDESRRLLTILRGLADSGVTVLLISHHLQEVIDVASRVTVLRNGSVVGTYETSETSTTDLVEKMLGYSIGAFYPDRGTPEASAPRLSVRGLTSDLVHDLTFSISPGEVVSVTGLAGMGQDDLPQLIYGSKKKTAGLVSVDDRDLRSSIADAMRAGVVLVPANRHRDALWTAGTAQENLTISFLSQFTHSRLLQPKRERAFTRRTMLEYDVRPPFTRQLMTRFSGGNQQKLVMARALHLGPKVLVLHEPTQGVDAGAKKALFQLVRDAAAAGAAILLVSSDFEEVAHMSHRVLIMRHGRIVEEFQQAELTEDRLLVASQQDTPRTQKELV